MVIKIPSGLEKDGMSVCIRFRLFDVIRLVTSYLVMLQLSSIKPRLCNMHMKTTHYTFVCVYVRFMSYRLVKDAGFSNCIHSVMK